jgi:hypothetical protein
MCIGVFMLIHAVFVYRGVVHEVPIRHTGMIIIY